MQNFSFLHKATKTATKNIYNLKSSHHQPLDIVINLLDDFIDAKKFGTSYYSSDGYAENAVRIDILSGHKKVGNFGALRNVGLAGEVFVAYYAVHRAFVGGSVVAVGERRRCVVRLYATADAGERLFEAFKKFIGFLLLEIKILLSAVSHTGAFPTPHLVVVHVADKLGTLGIDGIFLVALVHE